MYSNTTKQYPLDPSITWTIDHLKPTLTLSMTITSLKILSVRLFGGRGNEVLKQRCVCKYHENNMCLTTRPVSPTSFVNLCQDQTTSNTSPSLYRPIFLPTKCSLFFVSSLGRMQRVSLTTSPRPFPRTQQTLVRPLFDLFPDSRPPSPLSLPPLPELGKRYSYFDPPLTFTKFH